MTRIKSLIFAMLLSGVAAYAQLPAATSCYGATGPTFPCTFTAIPGFAQATVASKSTGNVASLTATFGVANTVGNSIVVVTAVGNGTAPTISDTNTNTYTQAGPTQCVSTTFCIYQFNAVNVKAGANTVTVNNGGTTTSIAMCVYELTGILTTTSTAGGTAAADAAAVGQSNSGTATSTALFTGAINNSYANHFSIAGFAVGTAAQTITVTSPYTNDSGQQNPTTPSGLFSFASASAFVGGGYTSAAATITSEPWVALIVSYRTVSMPVVGSVQQINGDPCGNSTLSSFVINNLSANTQIVAGAAQKNVYVCKLFLAPVTAAANVNIEESATSGNACATSPTGMMGGATAATGAVLAVNGGFVLPADQRAWMKTATAGDAVCLFTSAAVNGVLWYVQQ